MPKAKIEGKPRGRMSSYAFFVQTCREEHKKKCPNEKVEFSEFTRKCASKWKVMARMSSDAENSRSACFDWHNFIRSGIKYETLVHILFFGSALFVKFMILTCLFKKISAALDEFLSRQYRYTSHKQLAKLLDETGWYTSISILVIVKLAVQPLYFIHRCRMVRGR